MSSTAQIEWAPTRQAILDLDPSFILFGETFVWFRKVEAFRKEEDEQMYGDIDPSQEDLEIHKFLLQRLISDGERLLESLRENGGLLENPKGVTMEDVDATVDSLRITFRGWHNPNPMPKEERERLLIAIFPDVP